MCQYSENWEYTLRNFREKILQLIEHAVHPTNLSYVAGNPRLNLQYCVGQSEERCKTGHGQKKDVDLLEECDWTEQNRVGPNEHKLDRETRRGHLDILNFLVHSIRLWYNIVQLCLKLQRKHLCDRNPLFEDIFNCCPPIPSGEFHREPTDWPSKVVYTTA